jgi:hypothetical protein
MISPGPWTVSTEALEVLQLPKPSLQPIVQFQHSNEDQKIVKTKKTRIGQKHHHFQQMKSGSTVAAFLLGTNGLSC